MIYSARLMLVIGGLVVAAVASVPSAAALADQPIKQSAYLNFTYSSSPNTSLNPCSFPVTVNEAGTAYFKLFLGQSGQPVGLIETTPQFVWTYTGPNGTSLASSSPAPTRFDGPPSTYIVVVAGTELDFHQPGTGTLFKIAGRTSQSFDFTTNPPTISPVAFVGTITGDTTTFCSLLSS